MATRTGQGDKTMAKKIVVDVDKRGRVNLARARNRDYSQYMAEEMPDGTLVLTPCVTISVSELSSIKQGEME